MTVHSEALAARVIPVHGIAWEDAGPGLKAKPLWADPATQRRAYVGVLAPGARLPLHRHLGDGSSTSSRVRSQTRAVP